MSKVIEWLKNLFAMKSPCCRCKIKYIGIHHFFGGGESNIYECSKCHKQWIWIYKGGEQ